MGILSILVSRVISHSEALPRAGAGSRQNVRATPGRSLLVSLSQHHSESQCLGLWMCSKKTLVTPPFARTSDKYSKIAEDAK